MKNNRHAFWLEWGFRLLLVMLLGLWFLIPNTNKPASYFLSSAIEGSRND
mgnify:CR=1 FL=1